MLICIVWWCGSFFLFVCLCVLFYWNTSSNRCSPQMVEVAVRVKDVKCGLDGSMFLTSTGTLLACGRFVCMCMHVYMSTEYFIA